MTLIVASLASAQSYGYPRDCDVNLTGTIPTEHHKAQTVSISFGMYWMCVPRLQGVWDQHGAHLGPTGPMWAHVGPMNPAIWVCMLEPLLVITWTCQGRILSTKNCYFRQNTTKINNVYIPLDKMCILLLFQGGLPIEYKIYVSKHSSTFLAANIVFPFWHWSLPYRCTCVQMFWLLTWFNINLSMNKWSRCRCWSSGMDMSNFSSRITENMITYTYMVKEPSTLPHKSPIITC